MALTDTTTDVYSQLGCVEISGKKYACGLFWAPLTGSNAARKIEIRRLAQEQSMSMYAMRGKLEQVGFAILSNGVKLGQPSFASALAGGLSLSNIRSFVCAAKIGSSWVYVACYNGIITYNGDLVGDEETIRSALVSDVSAREWDVVIAPIAWGIPSALDRDITVDVLKNKTDAGKLIALQASKKIYYILSGLVVLAAISQYAYNYYIEREVQAAALIAQAAELKKAEQVGSDEIEPDNFVAQCENFIASQPSNPGGWLPVNAVCEKAGMTLTWSRTGTNFIEPFLKAVPFAIVTQDLKSASLHEDFKSLPFKKQLSLPLLSQRALQLTDASLSRGLEINIVSVNDPVVKKLAWQMDLFYSRPSAVLSYLNAPGFKIQVITVLFKDGALVWDMKGVQYGK
jgi:hypothetical protein